MNDRPDFTGKLPSDFNKVQLSGSVSDKTDPQPIKRCPDCGGIGSGMNCTKVVKHAIPLECFDCPNEYHRAPYQYTDLSPEHPTPAGQATEISVASAGAFEPSQVTLCPSCNQMTHTIMSDTKGDEDYCGKCGKVKLDEPQTRDFAAEAKQVEKILNRPHEPDYQCTQCSKSPAEHTTAGAGDTPTKTEN